MPLQRGTSSIELIITISILAITAAIAVPAATPIINAAAVEAASQQTSALFALARDYAIATGVPTSVRIDQSAQRILVHSNSDTIANSSFSNSHIHLTSTRDSMAYSPSGLGLGAANLLISLSLGNSHDTISISRLGRVSKH